jgi:hypothetical protein
LRQRSRGSFYLEKIAARERTVCGVREMSSKLEIFVSERPRR